MKIVLILLLCCAAAWADAITNSSAFCEIRGLLLPPVTQAGTTGCAVGNDGGGIPGVGAPFAGVINQTPTYTPQAAADDYATVVVQSSAWARPLLTPDLAYTEGASFTAQDGISVDLMTEGPVRQGFLVLDTSEIFGPASYDYGSDIGSNFDIGSISGYTGGNTGNCYLSGESCLPEPAVIPFTLGDAFSVDLSTSLYAIAGSTTGALYEAADLTLMFRLTEQDGVTPVPIERAQSVEISREPEPSTFSMLLLAALASALRRKRRAAGWRTGFVRSTSCRSSVR
jgi:hypothetical protein